MNNIIRKNILESCYKFKNPHLASCLSCVDILVGLYINKKEDDIFILSKGHANLTHWCILKELNLEIPEYPTSHPEINKTNIKTTSGSLGQGLGVSVGFALANKINKTNNKVYCLIGDCESYEGIVWEAAIFAAQNKLPIILMIDYNKKGVEIETINKICIIDAFKNIGWDCIKCSGHNSQEIDNTFKLLEINKHFPILIVFDTVKGYGLPSIYNDPFIHYTLVDENNIDKLRKDMEIFFESKRYFF